MIKKALSFFLGFTFILIPFFLLQAKGLVPDCTGEGCGFEDLIKLVNNVIDFVLFYLATPLFALIMVYVGWLYISDMGSAENHTKAIKILKNALFGYVIALASWLIINTIVSTLGFKGESFLN